MKAVTALLNSHSFSARHLYVVTIALGEEMKRRRVETYFLLHSRFILVVWDILIMA